MKKDSITKATIIFAIAAIISSCGASSDDSSGATGSAFVLTTDYTTGSYSVVDGETRVATSSIGATHGDAAVTTYNGLVYVVNRFGADNIQVIDPGQGYATVSQFSVDPGSNPYDIAFVSDNKAYVSRYELTELLIVNPSTGEQSGVIDLSAYADADGVPEMSYLHISGDKLYVAIQALDRNSYYSPVGSSVVVVIDTGADTVTGAIELPYQNPVTDFVEKSDGTLLIGCAGYYGMADGGVIEINGTKASAGGVTEEALGGDINGLAIYGNRGFAVISDASFNTLLQGFNLSGGGVEAIYQPSGFVIGGITISGSKLWVSDRTATNPGVRIFSAKDGAEITSEPVNVGLPPVAIVFP